MVISVNEKYAYPLLPRIMLNQMPRYTGNSENVLEMLLGMLVYFVS